MKYAMVIFGVALFYFVVFALTGCADGRATDVAPTPTQVNINITAAPANGNIDISVNAKVYGQSKSAALKRVAADLLRLADDLNGDVNPPTKIVPETPRIVPEIEKQDQNQASKTEPQKS
jgi:hypothetical protein